MTIVKVVVLGVDWSGLTAILFTSKNANQIFFPANER